MLKAADGGLSFYFWKGRAPHLLQRLNRLNKGADIKGVLKEGTWISGRFVTVHYRPGKAPESRYGIVVSKRVGGAVTRNLVKRRLREACRVLDQKMSKNWDLVVIGRRGSDRVKYAELKEEMEKLCRRGRLM